MEMKRVTIAVALFIVAVSHGEAFNCKFGSPGSEAVLECVGSCFRSQFTRNGKKTYTFGCVPIKYDGCLDVDGFHICYCNYNLCNTGGSGTGEGVFNSNPYPSGGSGGEFNFNSPPSSGSTLKVTWMVTCLVAIATVVSNVAI